ncbi:MAG: tripartite tricarboxylate transporter substrate binding protein [Pseudomonadota bacterium]
MQKRSAALRLAFIGFISIIANAPPCSAQDQFPSRVVTIVSPFSPGSTPDVASRLLAPILSERLGKPVIVENKVGANGNIAMASVARAAPDGYTLIMAPDVAFCVNPNIYANLPFDARRDFVPISSVVTHQFVLFVRPDMQPRDLPSFVEFARAARPPLLYASIGVGSLHHLAMEMLKQRANIDLMHVPYRGGSAALTAILGGDVQAHFSASAGGEMINSGRLKALASTGVKRLKSFPNLPTVAETYPDYSVGAWIGLFAPAGTPDAIVARLRKDVREAIATPFFAERINVSGSEEPLQLNDADFLKLMDSDCGKYGPLVKSLGIKAD